MAPRAAAISMSSDLDFTGERFVPGIVGEIAHEHWHRYAFARALCRGRRVLDAACGEGYGSALLADEAADVVGVDVADEAVGHARATYSARRNLRFELGSVTALPLPDASVDVIVSFETIEHLPADEQPRMLAEFSRVLVPGGILVLSAPNPVEYSQARGYRNPFHLHEPARAELEMLLGGAFPARRWWRQRRYFGSALWDEAAPAGVAARVGDAWVGDASHIEPAAPPAAMYFVVVAARMADALPDRVPALSLFSDRNEAELARIDARAAEVMRLDALLAQRDSALDRQSAHVRHLEAIAAFREALVVERDGQLAAANADRDRALRACDVAQAERDDTARQLAGARAEMAALAASRLQDHATFVEEAGRLERALAAQDRIIAHRQSLRWWLALPWLRVKLWWQRWRTT